MMKKIINIFSLIIMFLIIFSCSKEANKNIPIQPIHTINDRLMFQNFNEYQTTYSMLCKFHTEDDLRFWAQSKNHTTLLDSQDSLISKYSGALRTILNKDYEFELGDSIILFNKGILYAYSKNETNKISLLDNPEKFKIIGAITASLVGRKDAKTVDIGANKNNCILDPFDILYYQPCSQVIQGPFAPGNPYSRQFVAQLYDETHFHPTTTGPWFDSNLFLYIKLEEHPSSGWRTCYNQREVRFQIYGTAIYKVSGQPNVNHTIPVIAHNYSCSDTIASGPLSYTLATTIDGSSLYGYKPSWTVSVYGFIFQHILGDTKYSTTPTGATYPYNDPIW